ncbi:translation initiation factor IF-2 [Eilatimonas milleporae]|uniref:Translation initiation factor IF-2 n=1 Tax=Eilatimonas milleporae TaxID=911205 RepID=A0A3M0C2F0_9PROT|nr:translation initiation factor IF-2 [Eilatimonas milleporae]RMB02837.1 translation initiation factor 2 (bIF-2) [Eilatimonas milleporae]
MSDDKKLTLSSRATLGVGKGVEKGQVRQNFSHGRSKAVVVERKKKRLVKKGEESPAAPAPQQSSAPKPFVPKRPAGEALGSLTNAEMETRAKALEEAQRRAEEDARRREVEEEERKKRAAAEQAARDAEETARQQAEVDAKRKAEEVAAKKAEVEAERKAEEVRATREKAEEDARKKSELEARAVQMRKASEARKAAETTSDDAARARAKPKRGKERKGDQAQDQRGRGRGGADRRRGGRLTISRALEGEDARQRSVAAFRRAQAKKRQAAGGANQPSQRQAREVTIPEAITVQELANRMAEKSTAVIKTLMKLGVMATINETLDQDTAELVVSEFGHTPKRVSESDVEIGFFGGEDRQEDLAARAPIVTVMGHVDHGKTSLLDKLREANVVAGEAGGITQHIGAYQVSVGDGARITFLDTPGHAAFTQMRARGASVTDIVVLVVAADDGVMPQTIEAINHAKAAEVPIIVAINKMDKEGANPDRVRQELLQHEVVVETYSGDVQEVEVSALKGTGMDSLKEAIHLQAELLELVANPDRTAEGVVVEAKLDKGRGPVATVLVQRGTLSVGDILVAGPEWGKVRALVNDRGEQVKTAGPSVPVEVLGLNGVPGAGDDFAVVDSEARAREITEYRQGQMQKRRQAAGAQPKTLENLFSKIKEKDVHMFDVVLKGDVQGSVEAITQALENAGNEDISCRVIHGAVGGITESDITLAEASEALVIGFNVRPNKQAREAAEQQGITIKYYSVIYDLIDEVKAAMAGQLGPEYVEDVIGRAEIREVFSAGKAGKAAGCFVVDGTLKRDRKARILRDDVIVYNGQIANLRRFKDDVNEVKSGQECGMAFENFTDFKAGDVVEVYELHEVERTL